MKAINKLDKRIMKKTKTIESADSVARPIDCHQHDYIELACMHRYDLIITLTDGQSFSAKAVTTQTRQNKIEYLIAESDEYIFEISMNSLALLEVISKPAHFDVICFD